MKLENIIDVKMMKKLEEVNSNIQQKLSHGDKYLNGSIKDAIGIKGKMLRPLLLLIGSSYGRHNYKTRKSYIELATAIEILHLATLIHDDVIDESKLRRGRESIQSKYSKPYAIYMGDFLLSQSFLMIAKLNVHKEVGIRLAKAISQICVGEMKQHKWRYNTAITPMSYLRIASGKTATLFSISLSSGALHGKADKNTIRLLGRVGYYLGMAFQLIDDLLDYVGDEQVVGKDLRADLVKGFYSLPVIYALNGKNGLRVKELLDLDTVGELDNQKLIEEIKNSSGIIKTKDLATRYSEKAIVLIEMLPSGEGKGILQKLVPILLERVL